MLWAHPMVGAPPHSSWLLWSLWLWVCSLSPALAQEPWSPWSGIGPFPYSWDKGAENPLPFRTLERFELDGAGPDPAVSHKGRDKLKRSWSRLADPFGASTATDVGRIEIVKALPETTDVQNARVFLHRSYTTAVRRRLPLMLGSDDGVRVWWNGKLCVDQQVQRALKVGDALVELNAAPGMNHLLVEVSQVGGGFGFQVIEPHEAPPAAVDEAIERGVRWLLDEQFIDGSWDAHAGYRGGHAAYTAYVLLKMGVPPEHPGVRKAMAYSRTHGGDFTYSAACDVLALAEMGDRGDREWMERRVDQLVDWQESSGLFGYPLHPDGNARHAPDLSNTLFVALAFKAAASREVKIPTKTWQNMVKGTLRNIGRSREIELKNGGKGEIAGFYYWPGKAVTGSMTTAGLSILKLAEGAAGKRIARGDRTKMKEARARGLAWLGENLDYSKNPGEGGHHYFFLYGIERVASLLGLNEIGGKDWYAEGANYLITIQDAAGHWGKAPKVDTLLALLFLKRASLPLSGRRSSLPPPTYASSLDGGDVLLRAQGRSRLSMYVSEFSQAALQAHARKGEEMEGLRIRKVEYLVQDAGRKDPPTLLGTIAGDPDVPSGTKRFPYSHAFHLNGTWYLSCRVHVATEVEAETDVILTSEPIGVTVESIFNTSHRRYPGDVAANRFRETPPKLEVSSSTPGTPTSVIDGLYRTSWTAKADDTEPWIRLTLRRPQRGGRLLLTHARPRLKHSGDRRVSRVAVILDKKLKLVVEVDPHVMTKTEIDLRKERFKTLELRILDSIGTTAGAGVGFSEIELVYDR